MRQRARMQMKTAWVGLTALLVGAAVTAGLGSGEAKRSSDVSADRQRSATQTKVDVGKSSAPGSAPRCPSPGLLDSRRLPIGAGQAPVHVGLKTYRQTLRLADHEVVLTFDDGPWPDTTPAVLAALRAECVRANFFVIGRHAKAFPDLVYREVIEGHIVGHHSMTHPSVTLRGLDDESARREIDAGIEAVERAAFAAGAQPADHPHVPFFRFPGFADTEPLLALLDSRHFAVFGTDIWAADWLKMTPDYERQHVMEQLEAAPNHSGIVLFHDTRKSTAAMLPSLLQELKAKGYHIVQLVPAGGAAPPPPLEAAPDGWTSQTEAIIARVWPKIQAGAAHGLPPDSGDDLSEGRSASKRKAAAPGR